MAEQAHTPGQATYDACLLNDYGGGNVEWWQDYIRAELGRAHDFYQAQYDHVVPELIDGINAVLGLLQLLSHRSDISDEVRRCLTEGHRIDEARAAIAKAESRS